MKLVKINKNIFVACCLVVFAIVSANSIFILKSTPYYLFVFYFYLVTVAYFFYRDLKFELNIFLKMVYFFISIISILLGQYIFSFFDHQQILIGTVFFIIGIIFFIFSWRKDLNVVEKTGAKTNSFPFEQIAVFLLVFISFFARSYNLENFFPGIWYDEAQNGAEILRLMESKNVEFFISRFTYMPSMFFYISSVFVKIFGYNIVSLRLVSALLGTLSILAFYFLLKEIFKNWKIALLGAFIISFSRWHLNFSRIAFLGMQTVLLLTVFAYFYLKSLKDGKTIYIIPAGISLGLAQYTYSVVYFIHFLIAIHLVYVVLKNIKLFFSEKILVFLKIYALVLLITLPLIFFLIKNPSIFFQRANDISFFSEIKNSKSMEPIIKNITAYLLCFNFEGDYNGRHNLYKKPLFDYLTGVFFVFGIVSSVFTPGFRFFLLWIVIMFIPGLISITIETPQFYRIIGAMPGVFVIVLLGIVKVVQMINIVKNKKFVFILYIITAVSIFLMNIYQYYFLYPKHEGTYLSFSPEASKIGKIINEKKDYLVIISPAKNMYGFYQWEQKVVCDFITYKKTDYKYLTEGMVVYNSELDYFKKKGIIIILRPSDLKEIEKIENQYYGRLENKEEHKNPYNNEPIFYCYYIKKDDIIVSKDTNLIIRMEKI